MLVLTRRVGDTIRIGDDIEIKVLAVNKRSTKIGVSTPRQMQVMRGEAYDELTAHTKGAVNTSLADIDRLAQQLAGGHPIQSEPIEGGDRVQMVFELPHTEETEDNGQPETAGEDAP